MSAPRPAVAVLAKQPRPGRSKTRLSPPFTPEEAATLAGAMLRDVVQAVAATPGVRRVAVFEGNPTGWIPEGFEIIAQRGDGHAERIGNAFTDVAGPAVLIGMDTPQLSPELLTGAIEKLLTPGIDAVLGPAVDGGWWISGLRRPDASAFNTVPMSLEDTVVHQRSRFKELGLRWVELPELADIDDAVTAAEIARSIPQSHLARALNELDDRHKAMAE